MKPNAAFARYRAVDLLMFGLMLAVFETIAVALWLTKDNIFYLFNMVD